MTVSTSKPTDDLESSQRDLEQVTRWGLALALKRVTGFILVSILLASLFQVASMYFLAESIPSCQYALPSLDGHDAQEQLGTKLVGPSAPAK